MQTGPREKKKKITIRFVPNKTGGAKVIKYKKNVFYPAYIGVTFNRKTTKFPYDNFSIGVNFRLHWYMTEEADCYIRVKEENDEILQEVGKDVMDIKLTQLKNELSKVIDYEYKILGDRFKIAGIYNRLSSKYYLNFSFLVSEEISLELREILKDKLTYRQFTDMEAWGYARGRRDLTLISFEPFALLAYLTEEIEVISVTDLPISLREKFHSLSLLVSFQAAQSERLTLINWLSVPGCQSDFLNFIDPQSVEAKNSLASLHLDEVTGSKCLRHLQDIASHILDIYLKI